LATLIIVDDHPVTRLGMKRMFENTGEFEICGEFTDIAGVLRFLNNGYQADVALLDRMLPDGDGLSLVPILKARDTHVVIFSMVGGDSEIIEAIESGVSGYLLKSAAQEQIIGAVRAVVAGFSLFPSSITRQLKQDEPGSDSMPLTKREVEITELVALGQSNKVIGRELKLSDNTVRNHIRNILAKLGMSNRVQIASYVIKQKICTTLNRSYPEAPGKPK
jgi:DNA-binding NarL/FixJ family response regulator